MAPFDRRNFLSIAGGAATASWLAPRARAAVVRPNILFILADDLGYADLSCYGRRDIATPRIDRLAREGLRFTQAYSNSAVCSPTRAALITGRYQYRLQVGLHEPLIDSGVGLPPAHPTLPSLLRAAGYRTALVGKWHLGALPQFGPLQSGYESFYGFRGGAVDYYTHKGGPSNQEDLWDGDVRVEQVGYLSELLSERAESLIRDYARKRDPFFLSVHFSAPHWPWQAPGDQEESRRIDGKGLFHFDGGSMATYQRMVEHMDAQVGRILDALQATGAARDTLVVFTSDNGGERFSDTWPFSGRKGELLEGGVRVPAILRWPRNIRGGRTAELVTVTMDWLPTLLAAAGSRADPAYPPDGVDLMPLLARGAAPADRKLFWRFTSNGQRSMRDGNLKWLRIKGNDFLFDLGADPMERANLKERRRDAFERMVAEWEAWNTGMLPEAPEAARAIRRAADSAERY
jgi:arylsulfatase A-like enzyme